MARPKVGVVTVTFNSAEVLPGFLDSLLAQTFADFLLYAIDNASKDQTLGQLERWGDPRLRVQANEANLGVAEGNNIGIRLAFEEGCTHILLLNNDTEFPPDLFQGLLQSLEERDLAMVVPKILFHDRPELIWFAGGRFQDWKAYRNTHDGEGQRDDGRFDAFRLIEYAPTCCMLIHRDVFDRIGLMDEQYFVYGDDCDFCFRARGAGIRMGYDPRWRLYHKVSSLTQGGDSPFTLRYSMRNKVYFVRKHAPPLRALCHLALLQVYLHWRLAHGPREWRAYVIRQKAFREGLGL